VLLDDVWEELTSKWNVDDATYLSTKKYIKCLDRTRDAIKMAANRLSLDIEDLIKRKEI